MTGSITSLTKSLVYVKKYRERSEATNHCVCGKCYRSLNTFGSIFTIRVNKKFCKVFLNFLRFYLTLLSESAAIDHLKSEKLLCGNHRKACK